jgi:hypothetical protein
MSGSGRLYRGRSAGRLVGLWARVLGFLNIFSISRVFLLVKLPLELFVTLEGKERE